MTKPSHLTRCQRRYAPLALAISAALLLAACSTTVPKATAPVNTAKAASTSVPANWPTGEAYAPPVDFNAVQLPWQHFVQDARLQQVVQTALSNNRNLRQAVANIEVARANYRSQRAAQLPSLNASASMSRARSLSSSNGEDSGALSKSYNASASLSSYELDLFKKARSLTAAQLENYLATEQTARATKISLVAETISAWLTLAADQSQLALAQRTADSAQTAMNLTQKRLDAGVDSLSAVTSAQTVYYQAQADIASYTTAVAQDRNALELLTGQALNDGLLPAGLPDDSVLAAVGAGMSSKVLLQRPDILAAEHTLKADKANIDAARAAFFPSITLTSAAGIASSSLSGLFSGGAGIWSFAPSISLPIFDGGANQANLDAATAQQKADVAAYEYAIQTAFSEVADALARKGTMDQQLGAQALLVKAASDSERVATDRYKNGIDTYLTALDAQRTAYSAQQQLISTRLTALDNRVTLYRVLGGGQ